MRRILLLSIVVLSSTLVSSQNINEVFKKIPFEILPGLTDEDKDIIVVDKSVVSVPTPLGQMNKLQHSDTYLKIQTSEIGTTQIKLLPYRDESVIICVVKTVCDKACDSKIDFYDVDWNKVEDASLLSYNIKDFVDVDSINNSLSTKIDLPLFYPYSIALSDNSDDVTIRTNILNLVPKTLRAEFELYIKNEEITMQWGGDAYSIKK